MFGALFFMKGEVAFFHFVLRNIVFYQLLYNIRKRSPILHIYSPAEMDAA